METRIKVGEGVSGDDRTYLDEKLVPLERILGERADGARCEVEMARAAGNKHSSDHMWFVEIHILVPGEKSIYARNHAMTVKAAIDDVKEEAERQLRKEKRTRERVTKKKGAEMKRLVKSDEE